MSVTVQDILLQRNTPEKTRTNVGKNYAYSMLKGIPLDKEELTAGTEAIHFQPNSKLGTELVAILQRAMDMRDEMLGDQLDMNSKISREKLLRGGYFTLAKHCQETMFPQMRQTIKIHTGIDMRKIVDVNAAFNAYQPVMMFAIDISFDGTLATVESIVDTITGSATPTKKLAKYEDVYAEIAKTWDPNDTKLNTPKYKVIQEVFKKLNFATTMYFDPITAFFSHFFSPKQERIEPFTAREIAGIVIHEIGHVHTLVERVADDFYRKKYTDIVIKDYMNSKVTLNDKLDMIEEVATFSEKINLVDQLEKTKGFDLEKKVAKLSLQVAKLLSARRNAFTKQIGEDADSETLATVLDFLHFIGSVIIYVLAWSSLLPAIIAFKFIGEVFTLNNLVQISKEARSKRKHGDTRYTARNAFALETWADEFAVRLGFGGELNSAFAKITKLYNSSPMGFYTSGMRDSWFQFLLSKMWYTITNLLMGKDEHAYLGHENTPDRVKTIERTILDYFKTNKDAIGSANMDMMIADFEKAVAYRKKVNNPGIFYKAIELLGVLAYHLTTPTVVITVLYKVLSKTQYYKDLHDSILTIENNKMFYHRAKLETIAKDRPA